MLRVGGSRVSRTGREESRPLSGPRQIAVRIMYKTPQRASSAPSPIRNILASQFIAAPHNRTEINRGKMGLVPAGTTLKNLNWSFGPLRWFVLHGLGHEGPLDIAPSPGVRGFWPSGGRIGKPVMPSPA